MPLGLLCNQGLHGQGNSGEKSLRSLRSGKVREGYSGQGKIKHF